MEAELVGVVAAAAADDAADDAAACLLGVAIKIINY